MDECFSPARILDVGRIVLPTYRVRFVIVFYLLGRFIYPGIFYTHMFDAGVRETCGMMTYIHQHRNDIEAGV